MGTRALITIDGNPFIATHWDGHYRTLGKNLERTKISAKGSLKSIVDAAAKHNIDFADLTNEDIQAYAEERVQFLMKKHDLPREKILKGVRRGNIITTEDYEVSPIKQYGDFAEYQYDFDTDAKVWRVRHVSGAWDSNPATGDWWEMPLNKDDEKEFEESRKDVWEKRKKQDRNNT